MKQAYIPDIYGKERRKRRAGEGREAGRRRGMEPEVLLEALRRAGATFLDGAAEEEPRQPITKADLFALGLSGGPGSAEKRKALLRRLELPQHLTANGLLEALDLLYSREELEKYSLRELP